MMPDTRLRKRDGVRTRMVERAECLMVFSPMRRLHWLGLHAWLVFDLCDGRTFADIERSYLDIVAGKMPSDAARRQLREALDAMDGDHLIEAVPA
jgi:hypothetical protein